MRNTLQFDKWLISAVAVAVMGILQFVLFVQLAMERYPGGTIRDADTRGYAWNENWLSDLGRDQAWNGEDNQASARPFNTSVVILGVSMIFFFYVSQRAYEEVTALRLLGLMCGVLAGFGLVGIGCTPVDRHDAEHVISLLLWIIPMGIYAVLLVIDNSDSGGVWSWALCAACAALLFGIGMYALSTATSEVIRVQKLVAVLSMAWFLIITVRVSLAAFYLITHAKSRLQIANEQAVKYLRELERARHKPRPRAND